MAILDGNRCLSWKRCEIGRWLLRNVNKKSWVTDQIVSFSRTLRDPKPGFQGHCILPSRISQNRCVLGTKLLKNTNRKPYTIYLIVPLSMTLSDLWPWLQGHDIFRYWISQKRHEIQPWLLYNVNRKSYALCRTVIFPMTLTDPNVVFKVTALLMSNILGTKLLKNTNRKPY